MKVSALKEGDFVMNSYDEFALLEKGKKVSGIKMAVQPFLVETLQDRILIDAGLGWKVKGERVLIQNLKNHGFKPDDITKVIISHLHSDHIEGLLVEGELLFKNAEIFIQKREYEYALSLKNDFSYNQDFLLHLKDLKISWMDEDAGRISSEIKFQVTGGHTPFHQVFWIDGADETVFYGGDDLPTAGYLRFPIAYRIDFDGQKSMEMRKDWEILAKKEEWRILLYHDMKNAELRLN